MERTLRVLVDPSSPGSDQLMRALKKQFEALEVGTVEARKEPPPPGTLMEPMTVVIILQTAYWSTKLGSAILKIIREERERLAVEMKLPPEEVTRVGVTAGETTPKAIELPASQKRQEQFLNEVGDKDSGS
jgi:hypothetical protein